MTRPRQLAHADPAYVRVHVAAHILGLAEQTVRDHIAAGRLKAYKPGPRSTLIAIADLDAFMAAAKEVA